MYHLNDMTEHLRLDQQNSMDLYSVKEELASIDFTGVKTVVDAGCGSGAITEELVSKSLTQVIGVDGSLERIKNYSRKFEENEIVKGLVSPLEEINLPSEMADMVLCRFVLHHQRDPIPIMKELLRILRPGGLLVLIDSDGILFNIFNENVNLEKELSILKEKLPLDLFVGRKMKSHMRALGFSDLKSKHIPMHFIGDNLAKERLQYISRFDSMRELFNEILGEFASQKFINNYLKAMEDPSTELFYNKFVVSGIKKD